MEKIQKTIVGFSGIKISEEKFNFEDGWLVFKTEKGEIVFKIIDFNQDDGQLSYVLFIKGTIQKSSGDESLVGAYCVAMLYASPEEAKESNNGNPGFLLIDIDEKPELN